MRTSRHKLPQGEWELLIKDHRRGSSTRRPARPTRPASAATFAPRAHEPGTGAVRECSARCKPWPPAGPAAATRRLLRRPVQVHPQLLLRRNRPVRGPPRHQAFAHRRRRDRHRRGRRVPCRPPTHCTAGMPGHPTTRGRPWRRARAVAAPSRVCPLQAGKAGFLSRSVDADNRLVARGRAAGSIRLETDPPSAPIGAQTLTGPRPAPTPAVNVPAGFRRLSDQRSTASKRATQTARPDGGIESSPSGDVVANRCRSVRTSQLAVIACSGPLVAASSTKGHRLSSGFGMPTEPEPESSGSNTALQMSVSYHGPAQVRVDLHLHMDLRSGVRR